MGCFSYVETSGEGYSQPESTESGTGNKGSFWSRQYTSSCKDLVRQCRSIYLCMREKYIDSSSGQGASLNFFAFHGSFIDVGHGLAAWRGNQRTLMHDMRVSMGLLTRNK